MRLKSAEEIDAIGRAGEIVAGVLALVGERAEPGVSTKDLDALAEDYVRGYEGAAPAFKGLYGFPATLCTSVNDEVVHGIPSPDRCLEDGDLLGVDVGVVLNEMYADAAVTVAVGQPTDEARRLLAVTRAALEVGVGQASAGATLGDVGAAIQAVVEDAGFSVIRELVGHGVGFAPHEEPHVPNFGRRGEGATLEEGLVIAIEPMVNVGRRHIRTLGDGWTVVTADGSLSAHFEHTVAVTGEGPRILTGRPGD
jgi:methionyl aminopeptidase